MASAAKFRCDTKIQTDTLSVSDMQIPVRLRRKTRYNPTIPFIGLNVFGHNLPNKIELGIFFFARRFHGFIVPAFRIQYINIISNDNLAYSHYLVQYVVANKTAPEEKQEN